MLRVKNPVAARQAEALFIKRNEIDDLVEGKNDNDFGNLDEVVKYYPGSLKGPNPSDDPDHYGEWFMRNQPDVLNPDGPDKNNFHDLGQRYKWIWTKKVTDDDAFNIEDQDYAMDFLDADEPYQGKYTKTEPVEFLI